MANEIAPMGAGMLTKEQVLAKARERIQSGEAPKERMSGKVFLSLDGNTGGLTYGRDKTPLDEDQKFVAPLAAQMHGLMYWEGGVVRNEKMLPVIEGPIPVFPEGELVAGTLAPPRNRDGWTQVVSLQLSGIGGDLDQLVAQLDLSNMSKLGAGQSFLGQIFAQLETEDGGKGFFNPVLRLGVDSYRNKTHSRDVYFPVFDIEGWTDGETIIAAADTGLLEGPDSVLD